MAWHTFPHIPEDGAHILVRYKGCKDGNYFEINIREGEALSHIDKWCYYDDYKESIQRRLLNENTI